MHIFVLVLMNLIVIISSFFITYRLFEIQNFIDSLICWFIFYFSQIILVELLLGILGILYLQSLILVHLAILLIIYLIVKKQPFYFSLKGIRHIFDGLLKNNKVILLCAAVILGFGSVKVGINLINPPFGWDDLNYHFTFPVEWLKHGNLENPIVVSCDPSPTYYPINGSLFFLWPMLPLRNVFIADLGQVPFFVVAFLIVYALARRLKLSKEYALFSASIFTLIPNYFKQLEIAYIDVMVSTLLLAALYYLFLLDEEQRSLKNTVLFSISLGLMLGTKITALPCAFILYVPFLCYCFRKSKPKNFLFLIFISAFFITITGSFSYIRNFIQTGNPFYPLNLVVFGKSIFKGAIDTAVYRAHTSPKDYSLIKILFSEGLGLQTVIFILPAVLLGLPLAIIKNKKDLNFRFIYFLILPILLILAFRFIIPLANLRYLYALLAIGLVIAFYLADILNLRKRLIKALVVICLFSSIAEIAKHQELIISLLLTAALFFTFPYILKLLKSKKLNKVLIFILISLILLFIVLEKDYVKNEYARYSKMADYSGFWPEVTLAWSWLNQNTDKNNIAYIGRPVPFPLYGTHFKNNVYYVSVNKIDPPKLHYFKNTKYVWGYDGESVHLSFEKNKNYRGEAHYYVWLNNLKNRNTDYLFIYSLHQIKAIQFPIEDGWASKHHEVFNLVYKNNIVHIYKIIK